MKTYKSNSFKIARCNRTLILAFLIALMGESSSSQLFAGWAWPWRAGELQAQLELARNSERLSQQQKNAAERKLRNVDRIFVVTSLISSGVIVYLWMTRKTIQKVVQNEIVQNVVHEAKIERTPAQDLVTNTVVIDGLNVIYGSATDQKPCLLNLIALLLELQARKCAFKCYFDPGAFYVLTKAGRKTEAYAYRRLCHDFPDLFIEVPTSNKADDYILDYAHSHGTPIISNDHYRDYEEKYDWLKSDSHRRVSFVIHSGMIQIVPLGIQASIPSDLAAAESSLCESFGKPLPVKAPVKAKCTGNNGPINGSLVLARA